MIEYKNQIVAVKNGMRKGAKAYVKGKSESNDEEKKLSNF